MNKIKIRDVFLGTHCWEECPFEEVSFLRNEHHHDFWIYIRGNVKHNDRELEFLRLRIWLKRFMKDNFRIENEIYRFYNMSCEEIAGIILKELNKKYGYRDWIVEVSEDNNSSGIVY